VAPEFVLLARTHLQGDEPCVFTRDRRGHAEMFVVAAHFGHREPRFPQRARRDRRCVVETECIRERGSISAFGVHENPPCLMPACMERRFRDRKPLPKTWQRPTRGSWLWDGSRGDHENAAVSAKNARSFLASLEAVDPGLLERVEHA